jgi:hypothetical protein
MADRRSSTGSILQRNAEYGTIMAVDSDALRPLSSKALALSAFFVLFTPFLVVAVTEYLKAREFEGVRCSIPTPTHNFLRFGTPAVCPAPSNTH